jgi:hypothetical protein
MLVAAPSSRQSDLEHFILALKVASRPEAQHTAHALQEYLRSVIAQANEIAADVNKVPRSFQREAIGLAFEMTKRAALSDSIRRLATSEVISARDAFALLQAIESKVVR